MINVTEIIITITKALYPKPRSSFSIRLILHSADLLDPEPDGNMDCSSDYEHSDMTIVAGDSAYKPNENDQPVPLT